MQIDEIELAGGARLGLAHCPGRNHGPFSTWQRQLPDDLDQVEAWGANVFVSLIEATEFKTLGVPDFALAMRSRPWVWMHLPIPDMSLPGEDFLEHWRTRSADLRHHLDASARVFVHCAAGLGRTGLFAARLLILDGASVARAVRRVRSARPGTIETQAQLVYVSRTDAFSW